MKKITLLILLAGISCSSIAKQKKSANEMVSVQMFRTGCMGTCPTYSVEINKNGIVTYIAVRFCADTGTFTKNIGVAKAKELLDEVNSYRPDTCKDLYMARATDLPGMIYTIKYKHNKIKNIRNARWGPGFLSRLSRDIDAAGKKTDNIGWTKVKPPEE